MPFDGTAKPTNLWRIRDFIIVWWAQATSRIGTQVSAFVLPILVLSATSSASVAGYIGALEHVPYLFLALPAGALVERSNKRTVMLVGNLIRAVLLGLLACYFIWGGGEILFVAVVLPAAGIVYTFFDQASSTVFPRILARREDVARATSWVEATTALTEVLGPALGGLLIGLGATTISGCGYAFGIDALTYAIAGAAMLCLHTSLRPVPRTEPKQSLRASIAAGLRYLLQQAELRRLALVNFANVAMLATTWLSFMVAMRQQFHLDASKTGLLISAGAAAGIFGSFCTGPIGRRLGPYQVMLFTGVLWSIGETIIAMSVAPWMALSGLALVLWASPPYFATLYAYRMAIIPDELHTRINSIYRLLAHAGLPVGLSIGGTLLDALGWRAFIGIAAVLFFTNAIIVKLRTAESY